jgi:hypothetical protein
MDTPIVFLQNLNEKSAAVISLAVKIPVGWLFNVSFSIETIQRR